MRAIINVFTKPLRLRSKVVNFSVIVVMFWRRKKYGEWFFFLLSRQIKSSYMWHLVKLRLDMVLKSDKK